MAKGQKYHCGPSKWPKWARRIASIFFNPACKVHDLDYGPKTPYTKEESDNRFKIHMDRISRKFRYPSSLLLLSKIFHFIVMKKGEKLYQGDEVAIMRARKKAEIAEKKTHDEEFKKAS